MNTARHNEPHRHRRVDGAALRRARINKGLSQHKLAVNSNIGVTTLQRMESGDTSVRYDIAAKVARTLDIPVSLFYSDDDMGSEELSDGGGSAQPPEWFTEQAAQLQAHLQSVESKIERLLKECRATHRREDTEQ